MTTMRSRDVAMHAMLYALSEEKRIMKLSDEEYARRYKDCWDSCYGDLTDKQREKAMKATTKTEN